MSVGLLAGNDAAVAAWAFWSYGLHPSTYDRAFGIIDDDGAVVGAALFQAFNGHDVQFSYYGQETLTLGLVRTFARITLSVVGASRMTVMTAQANTGLIRGLRKFGFEEEGTQRRFYGENDSPYHTAARFALHRAGLERLARSKECSVRLPPATAHSPSIARH